MTPRAIGEQVGVDHVVHGNRDDLDRDDRDAEADRRFDALGYGQECAHTQEERQREVLDEGRLDKEAEVGFHQ
jgi:hypothetical protein